MKRIKVEDRTNIAEADGDAANDFTFCEICHLSNREDRMLLCDGCDRGFHCKYKKLIIFLNFEPQLSFYSISKTCIGYFSFIFLSMTLCRADLT